MPERKFGMPLQKDKREIKGAECHENPKLSLRVIYGKPHDLANLLFKRKYEAVIKTADDKTKSPQEVPTS